MQTLTLTFGDLTITTTTDSVAVDQPKAEVAATTAASSTKSTKSPRRSTKSTKKTTKSSKAKFSVAEIRAMVDNGQFYQAISACRDQNWDPNLTDARLRPKADKSTKSTKKSASKKPSAPKPKASAKVERPVDQEPEAPVKKKKLSASAQRDQQLAADLTSILTDLGLDLPLAEFVAKPRRKDPLLAEDMISETYGSLWKIHDSVVVGDLDDYVVTKLGNAVDYVDALFNKLTS